MINNNKILTLQGRANQNVFKKLKITIPASSLNKAWFFVDYSAQEFPLNTSFDVLFEGENKRLSGNRSTAKIVYIIDQFGHKLPSIPEGFKTICRFEFNPHIPTVFRKLPLLDQWGYNPRSISLAKHEDIEIGASDDTIIANLYSVTYGQFKLAVRNSEFEKKPTQKELLKVAKQFFKTDTENAEKHLRNFLQLGKIRKNDEKLELSEI